MIITGSFTCKSPFQQFQDCLPHCYNMHNIQYNVDILKKQAVKLWKDYSEDILAWLDGEMDDPNLDWDFEVNVCKALLGRYVENMLSDSEMIQTFEEWWKELMLQAMEDNAESLFNANGSCNIYGKEKE